MSRVFISIFAALVLLAGCSDEEDILPTQKTKIVSYLTGTHSPKLVAYEELEDCLLYTSGFQPDSAGCEERGSRPMRVLSDILQAVDFPRLFVFPVFGRTSCAEVLSGAGQSLESKIGYYDNGKWNKDVYKRQGQYPPA